VCRVVVWCEVFAGDGFAAGCFARRQRFARRGSAGRRRASAAAAQG